jgi:hypothetical protein
MSIERVGFGRDLAFPGVDGGAGETRWTIR